LFRKHTLSPTVGRSIVEGSRIAIVQEFKTKFGIPGLFPGIERRIYQPDNSGTSAIYALSSLPIRMESSIFLLENRHKRERRYWPDGDVREKVIFLSLLNMGRKFVYGPSFSMPN